MNNSIINSVINSGDVNVRRVNVFSLDVQQPTLYMPQYLSVTGYDGTKPHSFSFDIRDQYITAVNHFILSLRLPEITGEGRFAYTPYVGYKCIQHVSITCGDSIIWECDGEELFDKCLDSNILHLSGYSAELNDISTGFTHNDVIKSSATLYMYIKTPFDDSKTFSSLKLVNNKITLTVAFRSIGEVIIYDSTFNVDEFVRNFVYVTELHLIAYMVKDVKIKPAYIEIDRKTTFCSNASTPTHVIPDVYSCTSMSIYVKPHYGLINNIFISYPGFKQTEFDYVRSMVNRLLDDVVVINDKLPSGFPSSAVFVKVPENGQVTIQDVDIIVKIDNVPKDKYIYYHTNVLVFSTRKNSFIYNLSKKFSSIIGTYSEATDTINFLKVNHSITIADASIPVGFWTSQKNVYPGDNRSCYSKLLDLTVNDPFRKGVDAINKNDVISRLEVRFGNDAIYSETHPVSQVFNSLLTGSSNNVRKILFNMNPVNLFRPTTLNSNSSRGKDKLTVRVVYNDVDQNNPIYYVSKQVVIVCTDLYRIDYDNNCIKVTKITE